MRAEPAIEAIDLVKTYKGEVTALAGLSFDVEPGTVFGLLGPNGAGKSTTVKILTTLSAPDSGTALVGGVDVVQHPERVRRLIGAVAQESGSIAALTGRQNLRLQGDLQGMPTQELSRRSAQLLDTFGLTDAADRTVKTYSGGMRRRLDIAIALVHQPEVLFLDEPTTGLDPEARADTWRALNELAARQQLTILLTTHYLEEADQFASRLAIIDRGQIVAEGAPDELKAALRGDSVVVEMGDSRGAGMGERALLQLTDVGSVALDGTALRARVPDGARLLPSMLAALDGAGLRVESVAVSRPTLDDVYLHFAGRSFHSAQEVAA
ncbi:MAG TPA: ATP-binding cassette domain-containing protein [Acidimicrobiales bacterium]|nr:ATP-binding cassette domain-containing protein [Acidimicrobiales bacterium]